MTKKRIKPLVFLIIPIAVFILTHTLFLTKLPVFADEAIYIRWAQLTRSQPQEYRFLSMLDGKPPLHNWLISAVLPLHPDPLLLTRGLSLVFGLGTTILIYAITKQSLNHQSAMVAATIFAALPFSVINQRLGLAESLLTFLFTAALSAALAYHRTRSLSALAAFALCWGLSLWTKTNALFFAAAFALVPILSQPTPPKPSNLLRLYTNTDTLRFIGAGFFGLAIFALLKFTPLFPFLFSRSRDYTFAITEIITGEWQFIIGNTIPRVAGWLLWYLTLPLVLLTMFSGYRGKLLAFMSLVYVAPLIFLGKVLSARYFFPITPLIVMAGTFGWHQLYSQGKATLANVLLGTTLVWGILFSLQHAINPDSTWYVADDRRQYLEDWSSGHGIPEIRDYLRLKLATTRITVATEGYFGTLPDGLFMYFDQTPEIKNLDMYGIGQPVVSIPEDLFSKAESQEVYLVVNSHRYQAGLTPSTQLIAEYKRPGKGPSLLFIKINAPK